MDCNNLSFRDLDELLQSLGIEPSESSDLEGLERAWGDMPYEALGSLSKLAMLLSDKGAGDIDYSSFRWIPSSSKVFSFDVESFDPEGMYTLLLMGVSAIGKGELVFEDISETPLPEGCRAVEFTFCGRRRRFESEQLSPDWYDLSFLDFLNSVIAEEGLYNRLYFMSDGYQEVVLFYTDEIWAQRFKFLTGYRLFSKVMNQ